MLAGCHLSEFLIICAAIKINFLLFVFCLYKFQSGNGRNDRDVYHSILSTYSEIQISSFSILYHLCIVLKVSQVCAIPKMSLSKATCSIAISGGRRSITPLLESLVPFHGPLNTGAQSSLRLYIDIKVILIYKAQIIIHKFFDIIYFNQSRFFTASLSNDQNVFVLSIVVVYVVYVFTKTVQCFWGTIGLVATPQQLNLPTVDWLYSLLFLGALFYVFVRTQRIKIQPICQKLHCYGLTRTHLNIEIPSK